jgi:hypothetical protein
VTKKDFEQRLRTLVRQRPFQPFTVILVTGERIEVDAPEAVALGGGTAGYLSPAGDPILFDCRQVSQIITAAPETAS